MSIGISIKPTIGIGDALQFSSLPENYFRAKGEKLIDVNKHWFFDHNPYVIRDVAPQKVVEMWNFSPTKWKWPNPRESHQPNVYVCNAEIWAALFNVPVTLNRPRLYQYEDFPFEKREMILLHTDGKSHGAMPDHVIQHVIKKYQGTKTLYHLKPPGCTRELGLPKIQVKTLWDLAGVIAISKMLIGMDSGPSWIAACYPDVVIKKLRMKPGNKYFKTWVPLEIANIHSHWDDRCHKIFNSTETDIGFTTSYLRI